MSKEMWSQLKKFSNGDSLDADTLNVPIGQLGDRTSYLYARLKELLASGKMSSVVLTGVNLSTETGKEPAVGNVVYLDNETQRFAAAKATMSLYDDFKAADSAFTVGILQSKSGSTGNVIVYGSLNLNPGGSPFVVSDMIESGEEYRPGRYYLSANEAGKLTAHPNGPLVYVCTISGGTVSGGFSGMAIVSPQFLDIGTSHVHRTAVMTARPAGTLSTAGYLPIDETFTTEQVGPLALRFGGTWTSDSDVAYSFYLDQGSADWPNGVILRWRENGKESDSFKVAIHAPDEEVKISNGLTARLSLPASGPSHAYANLSANQRTWETLVFPEAGRGWLDHEARGVAGMSFTDGPKVAIRGRFDSSNAIVRIAFPEKAQVCTISSISSGDEFSFGGKTYEFTADTSTYSGENAPVALGTCLADSALFLVEALSKDISEDVALFAVHESNSGNSAKLLVIGHDNTEVVSVDGTVIASDPEVVTGSGFDVKGATGLKAIVFDGNGRVLSDDPIVDGMSSYTWKSAREDGRLSLLLYQDVEGTASVASGSVLSSIVADDEPEALFDYVIGMDPKIANYWPPVPPKSAALIVNGVEMDNKAILKDSPTVSFGRDTIHWFSSERGKKPWPEGFVRRGAKIDPAYDKTQVMHWVRGFQGATGPVTSLQVRAGSPLKLYGYGTDGFANTGDLELAAEFDFRLENGGAPGFNVPKRTRDGVLIAGPVVERIVGGAGVSVISRAGCPDGQGTVVIALDNGAYRNQFTDIALENSEQAKIGMFPYIRLKGYSGDTISSPSAFTATMRVPTNLPDGKYALMVSASVFGESGFSGQSKRSACIKFAYNILPDFSAGEGMMYRNLKTSLLKPDSERTVLVPFGHSADGGIAYNGFDPVFITTDDSSLTDKDDVIAKVLGKSIPAAADFAVQQVSPELRPGYLVGVRISRAVTQADGVEPYTGGIGFINLSWSLVSLDDYGTVPRSPKDLYARDVDTGLYHEVVASTRDGVTSLEVDQEGVVM